MTAFFSDLSDMKGLVPAEAAIANRLRNSIYERVLPPGSKLPEEHLAEVFKTTRARIRRVLLALSREHVVDLQPARGAFVAQPSPEDARQVLAARHILEIGILEHPCQPLCPDAEATLHEIIRQERTAYAAQDTVGMIRLSGLFHVALARALGNEVVVSMLQELILRTSLIIASFEQRKATCCLTPDHDLILNSLRDNAREDAARLMTRHLLEIEQNLDFTLVHTPLTSLGAVLSVY